MLKIGQRARNISKLVSNTYRQSRFLRTETNVSDLVEEERHPWYRHDQFYPIRTGEDLASSFKVIGKLGQGAYSTVWLCRDTRYVCALHPAHQSLIIHVQEKRCWLHR